MVPYSSLTRMAENGIFLKKLNLGFSLELVFVQKGSLQTNNEIFTIYAFKIKDGKIPQI